MYLRYLEYGVSNHRLATLYGACTPAILAILSFPSYLASGVLKLKLKSIQSHSHLYAKENETKLDIKTKPR